MVTPRPQRAIAAAAIFRANKVVQGRMTAALASVDLAPDRYEMLGLLARSPGGTMSLSDLGRALPLHPATTTYAVDALEKRGLVKREPDPRDRRGVLARVTPAGRETVKKATKLLDAIAWGLSELDDSDAAALATSLSRVQPS